MVDWFCTHEWCEALIRVDMTNGFCPSPSTNREFYLLVSEGSALGHMVSACFRLGVHCFQT